MSPYDQFDAELRHLIREGCTPNEALQALIDEYPESMDQAIEAFKRIQAVERGSRDWDNPEGDDKYDYLDNDSDYYT